MLEQQLPGMHHLPHPTNCCSTRDAYWMQQALQAAEQAGAEGEVPVGAVLVESLPEGDRLLSVAHNCPISTHDPSAHAEIAALRAAGASRKNYRLPGTTLYVTLEPCGMCAMALVHARVSRVVYACSDPKTGALGGAWDIFAAHSGCNHRFHTQGGCLSDTASALLRHFFAEKRR